jgi:hypothetical protein
MNGNKQRWVIGGSILLAAANGLIAVAEDPPAAGSNVETSENPFLAIPPAPASEPTSAPVESSQPSHLVQPYCPQTPACGLFARFKQRCQAKYWGYPEEFCEPALGSMVMNYHITQIANGQAARMGLYQYDFLPGSSELNVRGKFELAKISMQVQTNTFPMFIEPTPASPELDELRRQSVWRELSTNKCPMPLERIIIGSPNIRGVGSGDSLVIDRNRLGLTSSRGISAGGGGMGIGSSTTSGATGTSR